MLPRISLTAEPSYSNEVESLSGNEQAMSGAPEFSLSLSISRLVVLERSEIDWLLGPQLSENRNKSQSTGEAEGVSRSAIISLRFEIKT